jgi:hypothetical protein
MALGQSDGGVPRYGYEVIVATFIAMLGGVAVSENGWLLTQAHSGRLLAATLIAGQCQNNSSTHSNYDARNHQAFQSTAANT